MSSLNGHSVGGYGQLASHHSNVYVQFMSYRVLITNDKWNQNLLQLTYTLVLQTTTQWLSMKHTHLYYKRQHNDWVWYPLWQMQLHIVFLITSRLPSTQDTNQNLLKMNLFHDTQTAITQTRNENRSPVNSGRQLGWWKPGLINITQRPCDVRHTKNRPVTDIVIIIIVICNTGRSHNVFETSWPNLTCCIKRTQSSPEQMPCCR